MSKAKRNSLLFLSAAGVLVLLLVMSLPDLTLSAGKPFSLTRTEVGLPGLTGSVPGDEALFWIMRGLIGLIIVFFPVYIIYSLFSTKGRRRLVWNLIIILILFWVADYLEKHPLRENSSEQELTAETPAEDPVEGTPVPVFSQNDAPPWLAIVVILLAAAFGVSALAAGLWFFRQRAARGHPSLSPLAEAAQETIEALQAGGDFKTAIIRCYHEMNRVVQEERGITRETTMTPREFETYLISRGLPQNALETLTRLFERVRYGSVQSRTDDETIAFACLTEIVNTCHDQS